MSGPLPGTRPADPGPRGEHIRQAVSRLREQDALSRACVNMVPSENRLSPTAAAPLAGDFYHRYFFNSGLAEQDWNFRGGQGVGDLEVDLAIPALARLAGAEHVNLRPISGMSAMFLTLLALGGQPGDTVVSIDPQSGGHYATGSVIRRIGRRSVLVAQRDGIVDRPQLQSALTEHHPALVYLDLQNSLAEIDVAHVCKLVREHGAGTLVHADVSHTLGLVLGRTHANPLDGGADSMGGSTHKSFPGPQKGVLFTRQAELDARIRLAQFETLSSHHFAETLALGLAAAEFEIFGAAYAAQVITNARSFAAQLAGAGFDVVVGTAEITDCHQVWVRVEPELDAMDFSARLAAAAVRVNVISDLPGLGGRPALRLGLAEITFEGGREHTMAQLVEIFTLVRAGQVDAARQRVTRLRAELGQPYFLVEDGAGG